MPNKIGDVFVHRIKHSLRHTISPEHIPLLILTTIQSLPTATFDDGGLRNKLLSVSDHDKNWEILSLGIVKYTVV